MGLKVVLGNGAENTTDSSGVTLDKGVGVESVVVEMALNDGTSVFDDERLEMFTRKVETFDQVVNFEFATCLKGFVDFFGDAVKVVGSNELSVN